MEIVLDGCEVQRGPGNSDEPGSVSAADVSLTAEYHEKGNLTYLVRQEFEMTDVSGASLASIKLAFGLTYSVGQEPDDEDVKRFIPSVVVQSVPFVREIVASFTTRMGLPAYIVPLVRASDVSYGDLKSSR